MDGAAFVSQPSPHKPSTQRTQRTFPSVSFVLKNRGATRGADAAALLLLLAFGTRSTQVKGSAVPHTWASSWPRQRASKPLVEAVAVAVVALASAAAAAAAVSSAASR